MLKDHLKLGAISLEFVFSERDPCKMGNSGDIDVDGHGCDGTDAGTLFHPDRYLAAMLPTPSKQQLLVRIPRLIFGLVLFGWGAAMMVSAGLGLSPWEVMAQGISFNTGIPIGTVGILIGIVVLLLWIPLKEKFGIGTVLNVFIIGIVIDLTLWMAPEIVENLAVRWMLLIGGILLVAVGSGFYIGAGLGPGPRDGLMTGIARRGVNIGLARFGIEITVLVIGWMLGGTVGIGTVLFAFGMGPLIAVFLPLLSASPLEPEEQTATTGL
jgi:uncharacterized membrane protein YczE